MIKKKCVYEIKSGKKPSTWIQRGFNVQVGYGIHTWFSFGVLLIDGKDGEWLIKEDSDSEMSQQRHSDAIKTLCLCCSV